MELISQILQENDLNDILELEKQNLAATYPEEADQTIALWNSKFREEALRHYIQIGWSFGVREKSSGQLLGYFIAQPLLFFNSHTQSLWVEHLSAKDQIVKDELLMISYKLGREKHLQRVYFPQECRPDLNYAHPQEWDSKMIVVRTTKDNS